MGNLCPVVIFLKRLKVNNELFELFAMRISFPTQYKDLMVTRINHNNTYLKTKCISATKQNLCGV